jgi:hypothetical protein
MLLVTEMNASFQKLAHGEIRQCHDCASPLPVVPPRGTAEAAAMSTGRIVRPVEPAD